MCGCQLGQGRKGLSTVVMPHLVICKHAALIFLCAPMPESALDGRAVKMVLLCLLGFFPPPIFLNKHVAASGQLLFSRGDVTSQNLNFSLNCVCCHLCKLLFSESVNTAL